MGPLGVLALFLARIRAAPVDPFAAPTWSVGQAARDGDAAVVRARSDLHAFAETASYPWLVEVQVTPPEGPSTLEAVERTLADAFGANLDGLLLAVVASSTATTFLLATRVAIVDELVEPARRLAGRSAFTLRTMHDPAWTRYRVTAQAALPG